MYLLTCLLEPFMPSFSNEVWSDPSCNWVLSEFLRVAFLPQTSLCVIFYKVLRQLNLSLEENLSFSDEKGEIVKAKTPWDFLPAGHKIGRPTPLFEELVRLAFRIFLSVGHYFTPHNLQCLQKDENVSEHRKKYAGSQAERRSQEVADAEAMKISNQLKSTTLSGNCLDTNLFCFSPDIRQICLFCCTSRSKEKNSCWSTYWWIAHFICLLTKKYYLGIMRFLSWQVCCQAPPCPPGLKPRWPPVCKVWVRAPSIILENKHQNYHANVSFIVQVEALWFIFELFCQVISDSSK